MSRVHCFSGELRRARSKKVATLDGRGWTSAPDGYETAKLEIEIDLDAIIRDIGERAMRSKRNTARGLSGAIKVKAVDRRREPAT
jgi:hypothetical protein